MLAALASMFVLGCLFSLLVAASAWLYTSAVVKREKTWPVSPFKLPQFSDDVMVGGESCKWFNLVTSFLFQELRDTAEVKSLILKKVNKEFSELMFTKKEGRMLEQLTVRDYDLGTSLPLFSNVEVLNKKLNESANELEELCLGVNVEYSGGCKIGIDADLIFNRVAYVAIRIVRVKGRGQLQFSTVPHTHWSFAFCEDPELECVVESTFEGRSFPQLSLFMEAQLRRWVRQKHTLPARKTRYKPFFSKPKPQSQLDELYVHNQKLTVGRLYVEIVKASRLLHSPSAVSTFCTLNTSSLPWQPLLGVWRSRWAEHEFRFELCDWQLLGIRYRLVVWDPKGERGSEFIVIFEVMANSLAASSGVQVGDVIVRVNNVKVHSVAQVQKTINKTKHGSVLLTVKRPPKHVSHHMLRSGHTHRATPTSHRATSGVSSDVEGEECGVREDGDSISLRGVRGERPLTSGQRSTTVHSLDGRAELLPRVTRNVDEEVMKQTDEVPRCSHWSRNKFCFNVGPQHRYLNLRVYDRLDGTSEDRGEMLVGHVTVPLMDVALECLVSSSGKHHQRYVLLPPQLSRATSSRATMQASEGRRGGRGRGKDERKQEEGKKFVGSLLLRFKYATSQYRARNQPLDEEEEEEEEDQEDGEEKTCDSPVEEEEEEVQHNFQAREMEGTQKCNICTKRIWALKGRVMVCGQCGVQCHKKCLPLAHQRLPCRSAALHMRESQGYQIYEDLRAVESREHRALQQQRNSDEGFVTVPTVDDEFVRVEDEGREGKEDEGREGEEDEGREGEEDEGREGEEDEGEKEEDARRTEAEPDGDERENSSQSSSDEIVSGRQSEDEREQALAELLARTMLSQLPEQEHVAAMQSKVTELESEVERVEDMVTSIQTELSRCQGNQQENLRQQLRQHREKLEPMKLMRQQYALALQQMSSTGHENN